MGEEVRGEDFLIISWEHSVYEVRAHGKSNDFIYKPTALWDCKEDAHFVGSPWDRQMLRITPLPGREAICRRFAAMTHLRYPGATVVIVGGEDAEGD